MGHPRVDFFGPHPTPADNPIDTLRLFDLGSFFGQFSSEGD
jgi:hypothetical protein